jgi:tartrate dehydratase beta subunit/fumarate hydratase class I family protein
MFARMKPTVRELLAHGVLDLIGNGETHRNVDHAVEAQMAARRRQRANP